MAQKKSAETRARERLTLEIQEYLAAKRSYEELKKTILEEELLRAKTEESIAKTKESIAKKHALRLGLLSTALAAFAGFGLIGGHAPDFQTTGDSPTQTLGDKPAGSLPPHSPKLAPGFDRKLFSPDQHRPWGEWENTWVELLKGEFPTAIQPIFESKMTEALKALENGVHPETVKSEISEQFRNLRLDASGSGLLWSLPKDTNPPPPTLQPPPSGASVGEV